MVVYSNIDEIKFKNQRDTWWNNSTVSQVLDAISSVVFWEDISFFSLAGSSEFLVLNEDTVLVDTLRNWKNGMYSFSTSATQNSNRINISIREYGLSIYTVYSMEETCKYQETILESLIDFMQQLILIFENQSVIGPNIGVGVRGVTFSRKRPPYRSVIWTADKLVDIVSRNYLLENHDLKEVSNFKTLSQLELPFEVKRIQRDDILIIVWANKLETEEQVRFQLQNRNVFYTKHLQLKRDSRFNAFGDQKESQSVFSLRSTPFMTFYDDMHKIGYKAFVIIETVKELENELILLSAWMSNLATPDGLELKEMRLILNDRESALLVLPAAKLYGINKILFLDDQGQFWNINPSGNWIE